MTRQKLLRANELKDAIDALYEKRERLEKVWKLCCEDSDVAKKVLHAYFLQVTPLKGGHEELIKISAIGVFQAVSKDIADIEKEIKKLVEEFDEL